MNRKKSFADANPALGFISAGTGEADDGEKKSKRMSLLLRPSLAEDLRKIAYMRHASVNETLNRIIEEYTKRESEALEMYERTFGDGQA
jgi:hypothetical protein